MDNFFFFFQINRRFVRFLSKNRSEKETCRLLASFFSFESYVWISLEDNSHFIYCEILLFQISNCNKFFPSFFATLYLLQTTIFAR